MPTTPSGIVYPDSTGHTRLWEHLQALAESVESALPIGKPSAKITTAATQSLPNAAFTTILFSSTVWDSTGTMADLAGERIVVPDAGVYLVTAKASFTTSSTGRRIVAVHVNGVEAERMEVGTGFINILTIPVQLNLAAGAAVSMQQYQSSGGALDTYGASLPTLAVTRID